MTDVFRRTIVAALETDAYNVPGHTAALAVRHALSLAKLLDRAVYIRLDKRRRPLQAALAFRGMLTRPEETSSGWVRVEPTGACEARGALILADFQEVR